MLSSPARRLVQSCIFLACCRPLVTMASAVKKPALLQTAAVLGPSKYSRTVMYVHRALRTRVATDRCCSRSWLHGLGDSSEGFRDIFELFDLPVTALLPCLLLLFPVACAAWTTLPIFSVTKLAILTVLSFFSLGYPCDSAERSDSAHHLQLRNEDGTSSIPPWS